MLSTIDLSILVCALQPRIKKFNNAGSEGTKHKCCLQLQFAAFKLLLAFMFRNISASRQLIYTGNWKFKVSWQT
jgi:hypothetical protein